MPFLTYFNEELPKEFIHYREHPEQRENPRVLARKSALSSPKSQQSR